MGGKWEVVVGEVRGSVGQALVHFIAERVVIRGRFPVAIVRVSTVLWLRRAKATVALQGIVARQLANGTHGRREGRRTGAAGSLQIPPVLGPRVLRELAAEFQNLLICLRSVEHRPSVRSK